MNENEKNKNDILSTMGFGPKGDVPESAPESEVKPKMEEREGELLSHLSDGETSGVEVSAPYARSDMAYEPESETPCMTEEEAPPADDGEYNVKHEDIPPSYVDANFQCESEMKTPRSYYTPPQKPVKKKKEKTGLGFGRLVAACLACAVIGGLGGGALVASQMDTSGGSSTYSGNGSLNISNGTSTTAPDASTISTGEKLSGSQIYALGCEQAVGITTEITYKNNFGMETSTAVSGSGFIVTEDGYIVTNYHVIQTAYEGGYDVSVMLYNGESYPAEIVGFEKDNDIAVLKINVTGLPAATLGNSDNFLVGDAVYAIGNPLGELSFSMTTGSVSALDRSITTTDSSTGLTTTNNMFQIDAAVNEGNSGGPVYNEYGEVVGIVTAKYADTGVEGLGFAIPINDVLEMIEDLIEFGYVTGKPSFGITAKTVDNVAAAYYGVAAGAEVKSVAAGSCSEKAGLVVGDIITALNDTEITSSNDLVSAKKDYSAGDTIALTVYRSGDYIELTVTLDQEVAVSSNSESGSDDVQVTEDDVLVTEKPEKESLPTVPKD